MKNKKRSESMDSSASKGFSKNTGKADFPRV
jgi:hypothetical protein